MDASTQLFIICLEREEEQSLFDLAAAIGYPAAEIVVGTMGQAIKRLTARPSSPDHMIIDIGRRGSEVLADLDELALNCEPTTGVVVIGSVNDISFYRELKQRGILEYFPRPANPNDVKNVLAQALEMRQQQRAAVTANGIVVSCMSAASGDGGSTVAVNLAYCLAVEQKISTVLVDMDYQFGLIAKSLDLTAPFGIRELFDHPERGLDDTLVEKMLVKYGERMRIIASPNELQFLPLLRPELIRNLIDILRTKYKVVIIDLPHVWTHGTAAALKHSDHNILVGQLWLRSLTHATRLINAWQNAGVSTEHTSLIINRSGAKFREAISAEEFERICRQKIEAHLNNDIKAVVNAENQGMTVCETAPEGALLPQQFKQIASNLVDRFNLRVVMPQMQQGSGAKKGLRALFDKRVN